MDKSQYAFKGIFLLHCEVGKVLWNMEYPIKSLNSNLIDSTKSRKLHMNSNSHIELFNNKVLENIIMYLDWMDAT